MKIPDKIAFLLVDTLRFDCINYLSDKKYLERDKVDQYLETPTLDSLCKESVCFTHCYSTSSATVQTVTSMFTGTKQANHGMLNNGLKLKRKLDEKITTMAEILKKNGYLTAYAGETSKWFKAHNLLRGFDYDLTQSDKQLFEFLSEHKDEKIFFFALFEDVHAPYLWSFQPPYEGYNNDYFDTLNPLLEKYGLEKPEEPTDSWYNINKIDSSRKNWFPIYVQGVTKFDKGRFKIFIDNLRKIDFLEKDKSLLVLTADHGDGKYRHDAPKVFNHNGDPYDEIARVPLIVRLPNLEHKIRDDLVSTIDIFKIILDLCTNNKTSEYVKQKINCINPFSEKKDFVWHEIVPELYSVDPIRYYILSRTIITKDKKFILRGKPEVFLDPDIFKLNNHDFLITLFLNLMVRHPTEKEIKYYMERLDSGRLTNKQLYEALLTSKEYRKGKRCIILDRKNDPFETKQLDPTKNPLYMNEFLTHFNQLIDLEHPEIIIDNKISSEKIDSKELEEVEKELHKLGYL